MDLIVSSAGIARFGTWECRCALGRGGLSRDKHEGDGATPVGSWLLRRLLYRADRFTTPPLTALAAAAIAPDDGWCDDPADAQYNLPVKLPYAGRTERLWRDDDVYDLIVPLGYNDQPPAPGRGSAIFLHLARPDYSPTEGCVALSLADLRRYLAFATPTSRVIVLSS
ncbi:MAG TPA: L,D-transpeptidase family protein [Stellaceae bacterium]|nr:L,D-transpeptidase family protein [Stellaceae bacterium]